MHVLIFGQTQTGKTSLAKQLAASYKSKGIGVLVYDPINDPGWVCDRRSTTVDEFLYYYWNSQSCMCFIDEAGDVCKNWDVDTVKTATRGRHWGHRNHYIAQRASTISLTIRDQCSELFLFNSGPKDCKMHAEEWNCPEIAEKGPWLEKGEFFHKPRLKPYTLNRLF